MIAPNNPPTMKAKDVPWLEHLTQAMSLERQVRLVQIAHSAPSWFGAHPDAPGQDSVLKHGRKRESESGSSQ